MKTLFYYCFYRISKFYGGWEPNGYIRGQIYTCMSVGTNVLSILVFILYFFDRKIDTDIVLVVLTIAAICSFFLKEKKYKELVEKYKDEEESALKGWLVFAFVLGSILLFFVSMLLCGYWVSIE